MISVTVFCTSVKPSFQDGVFTARYHGGTCGTPPRCVHITVHSVLTLVSPNYLQKVTKIILQVVLCVMSRQPSEYRVKSQHKYNCCRTRDEGKLSRRIVGLPVSLTGAVVSQLELSTRDLEGGQ